MNSIYLVLFFLLNSVILSQEYGIISGNIKDAQNGQPIFGCNVVVLRTPEGAASDIDGNYIIKNIPFGKHVLKYSLIGYNTAYDTIELKIDNPSYQNNFSLRKLSRLDVENKFKYGTYESNVVVEGVYIKSFEYSGIIPTDSVDAWWVIGNSELNLMHRNLMDKMGINKLPGGAKYNLTKVYCKLLGDRGSPGVWSGYKNEFIVKEVIEMREIDSTSSRIGE